MAGTEPAAQVDLLSKHSHGVCHKHVQSESVLQHASGRVLQVSHCTAQGTYLIQHKANNCQLNKSLEVYADHAHMQAGATTRPQHVSWHAISHPWDPSCRDLPGMPLSWPHTPGCTAKSFLSEHGRGMVSQPYTLPTVGRGHRGHNWTCKSANMSPLHMLYKHDQHRGNQQLGSQHCMLN